MAHAKRRSEARPRGPAQTSENTSRGAGRRAAKQAKVLRTGSPAQTDYPVQEIVARLHHHRQRATYEAVGALRNAPAVRVRGWFARREAPENSFVVSRASGEPTRYPPEKLHPALRKRAAVLESADALLEWLDAHPISRR